MNQTECKIGLIGHLIYNQQDAAVNGQAAKTRNYRAILEERYGKENIIALDTNYFRKHLIANYKSVFSICAQCRTILILPTRNGLKLLLPVLKLLKSRYHFQILYPVVGGWLPEYIREHSRVRRLLHCVDYIFPETDEMTEALKGMGFAGVQTVYNFSNRKIIADLPEIAWSQPPFRFCTFSRVTKQKGIGEAIQAISHINKLGKRCELDIFGPVDPDYREEFEAILALGGSAVAYRGVLGGDEVVPTLSQYYAMLFPTYYGGEGMPGAMLEAFAAGLPVIASNWRYNSEVIRRGETGLIYELGDIRNLEAAILTLVDNTDTAAAMKRKCFTESRKYLPQRVVKPVFDIIEGFEVRGRKKVVFVILSLFGGGAERVVSILANALADRDWNVSVIVYQRKQWEYPLSENVKLHVLPDLEKDNPLAKRIKYTARIREILKQENADVALPFLAIPTVHTFFASRGLRCRFIATVRNNPRRYPARRCQRGLVNYCTLRADCVMLQTEEQKAYFQKAKNTFIVHNPVNPDMLKADFQYRDAVTSIASFGRLSRQKDHWLLIRAFARIASEYPQVRLQIFGQGEERAELERLIAQLGLCGSVRLMGSTDNVLERMLQADIFVLSSAYEGLPNALMEAMAVGLPCVATRCPTGPGDLIDDGENGILVPVGDESAMADAMRRLMEDSGLRKRLGTNARRKMQDRYTVDRVISEFAKELERQTAG